LSSDVEDEATGRLVLHEIIKGIIDRQRIIYNCLDINHGLGQK
jgi:hypothetical protein